MAYIAQRNLGLLAQHERASCADVLAHWDNTRTLWIPWVDETTPAVLGVDPGLSGAIVALDVAGKTVLCAYPMPTRATQGRGRVKRRVHGEMLDHILRRENIFHAFVEDPGVVMGGNANAPAITSPLSVAALHATLGAIEATLHARGVSSSRVFPGTWKKPYGLRKTTKRKSVEVASQIWPIFKNLRVRDNGHAEAALIARFGLYHTIWRR